MYDKTDKKANSLTRKPANRNVAVNAMDYAPMPAVESDAALPPAEIPATDPAIFYKAGADLRELAALPEFDSTPILKRLGPLRFARAGFPLMGFLATVYEHVNQHLNVSRSNEPPPFGYHSDE